MRLLWIAAVLYTAAAAGREVVNFDFAWRHLLGQPGGPPAPGPAPPRAKNCTAGEEGVNYGEGGSKHSGVKDGGACCTLCAADSTCACWDLDTTGDNCWIKSDCSTKKNQSNRISALLPGAMPVAPTPVPSAIPAAALPKFDDSKWKVIDAPHDMLISQPYDPSNDKGMAFIKRNVGWYRKHFKVPSDWKGSTVWIYFEGVFHETTAWLNGQPLGIHPAGYTSFALRLDNATGIKFGDEENVLALFVDASRGSGWWYEGGGLFRHQQLVRANPVHIEQDGAWVYSDRSSGGGAAFHTSVKVVNEGHAAVSATAVSIKISIYDTAGTEVASAASSDFSDFSKPTVVTATAASGIKNWTVRAPHLYTATVELVSGGSVVDAVNITTGVRSVEFKTDTGLYLNGVNIKMRGFCDHSSFAGVGAAVPDRIELFRAQALRAVGGNSWRMAHNPPALARLDAMDALGMLALDENRDFAEADLRDMRDLIKRDRSRASVIWWSFCNEGGCKNRSVTRPFRDVAKLWDPTRAVTQNDINTANESTTYLDVQGFSHRSSKVFDEFHAQYPQKPMAATECCSCMSQRGVDEDDCPLPKDGGCQGKPTAKSGVFYNNNIGKCTEQQVVASDSRPNLAGTFIWSGFDYLGEARGWPQNTKCRGTVSDSAGFTKETAYWLRSVWLSNVSTTDPGRPVDLPTHLGADDGTTTFIVESWKPLTPGSATSNRSIHVYSSAAAVKLELNGREVGRAEVPPYVRTSPSPAVSSFGGVGVGMGGTAAMVSFSVAFTEGTLTATSLDASGHAVGTPHSISSAGDVARVVLSIDAPSKATGTGTHVVADGEDVCMIRATLVDSKGVMVPNADNNVTFSVESGPGVVWTTHSGDPANLSPNTAAWNLAYHGLVRAIIRTTADHATPAGHRRRLRFIDVDGGRNVRIVDPDTAEGEGAEPPAPIVVKALVEGTQLSATVSVPVTADFAHRALAAARKY